MDLATARVGPKNQSVLNNKFAQKHTEIAK
jgi:hypothetical protein